MNYLKCPVCGEPLLKNENTYRCRNAHSFDIAKKGFTNLMLANQGHSLLEGDAKDMVEARSAFLDSGKYECLLNELINIIKNMAISFKNPLFCDIACGEGYYTSTIHEEVSKVSNITTCGIDISRFAIIHSCTRKNIKKLYNIDYYIGNMDYLPFTKNAFDILLNCFAPINEEEFSRVLKDGGYYIRVLPGVYHLYELKEFLYPEVHLNVPKSEEIPGFILEEERNVEDTIELDNPQIKNLFTMTPYYYKTSPEAKERLNHLDYLKTKIQFTIRIYKKKA